MDTSFYHISEKAVERVAGEAALTVPGVIALDAKLAGLAGRSFPQMDVHLDRSAATTAIDAEIATSYPAPIAAITDAVRATIIEHVRALCGLDVSRVNVTVANAQADLSGSRVTWDDVASHVAVPEPVEVRVSPSRVTSPVTRQQADLIPIQSRSLVEDLRDVTLPAPPRITHVDTPAPPAVRRDGFAVEPRPLASVEVPAPQPIRAPQTPAPVTVHGVRPPAVAPLVPVTPPAPTALAEVVVDRPPLAPVTVKPFTTARSIPVPQPTPVRHPVAPAPAPLKQITIQPVEKYYDRTR